MSTLLQKSWKSPAKRIWIILLCAAILMTTASVFSYLASPEDAVGSIFYLSFADRQMDFFNCLIDGSDLNVYHSAQSSLYPPLTNLMYYGLSRFIPAETLAEGAAAVRESARGQILFWVFQGGITLAMLLIFAAAYPGGQPERITLFLMGLVSMPVLYLTERGNCLPLAVGLVLVFLLWKDDPSRGKRMLGFLSLAIAANVKIYPAVFGLLLILEKKWKEAARLVACGMALFVLPLMIYGWKDALIIINNIFFTGNLLLSVGPGYKISWMNFGQILSEWTGIGMWKPLPYLLLALCLAGLLFLPRRSDRVLVLSLICIGFSDFSMVYNTLFYLPALLCSAKEDRPTAWLTPLTVLMAVSLFPLALGGRDPFPALAPNTWQRLNVTTLIECVSVMALTLAMLAKAGGGAIRGRKQLQV